MIERFAPLLGSVLATSALMIPMAATAKADCGDSGVTLGFFNGVQTSEEAATDVVDKLMDLYGPTTPAGRPLTYDLFYNDTQGLADFVETFEQRLREHDGLLAGRSDLFSSA